MAINGEDIVPGLGKKQAAVLNNEAGRQAEHKRHLDELGFPEYVEPDFVRHAPVSYDDPSNPTPSRVVNQAGQDLGATNDPLLSKSLAEMIDIQAIVKEAASEVFVSKDEDDKKTFDPKKVIPVSELGYEDKRWGRGGNMIRDTIKLLLFGGTGPAADIAELEHFYQRAKHPAQIFIQTLTASLFDAMSDSSRDDVIEIQRILRIPNENRRAEERRSLKQALDRQYDRKFGIKYNADGTFSPELTKFASRADMKIYFDILNGFSEDPIEQNEADAFVNTYGFSDEETKRLSGLDSKLVKTFKDGWDAFKSEYVGGSEKANIPYEAFAKYVEEGANDTLKTQFQRDKQAGTEQAIVEIVSGSMNIDAVEETIKGLGGNTKDTLNRVIDYGGEKIDQAVDFAEDIGTDFTEGFKGVDPYKDFPEAKRNIPKTPPSTSTSYKAGEKFKGASNDFSDALDNFRDEQGKKLKDLYDSAISGTGDLQNKLSDSGFGRGLSPESIQDLATKLKNSVSDKVSNTEMNTALSNVKNVLTNLVDQGKLLYDKATDSYQNIEGAKPEEIKEIQDNFKTPASPTQAQLQTDPSFEGIGADRKPTTFGRTQAELDVIARNKAAKDKALKTQDPKGLERFGMGPAFRPQDPNYVPPHKRSPLNIKTSMDNYQAWIQKQDGFDYGGFAPGTRGLRRPSLQPGLGSAQPNPTSEPEMTAGMMEARDYMLGQGTTIPDNFLQNRRALMEYYENRAGAGQQQLASVGQSAPETTTPPPKQPKDRYGDIKQRDLQTSPEPPNLKVKSMQKYNAWLAKAEEEGAMAKVQLDRVSDLADMMHDVLDENDELPGWIQNKISDSLHNLEASFTHLAYDAKKEMELAKTKETFKDFLAQAPSKGGFLKKSAGGILRALSGLFRAGLKELPETGAIGGTAGVVPFIERLKREGIAFGLDKLGPSQKEQEADLRRELAISYAGGQQFYDDMTIRQKAEAEAAIDDALVTNTLKLAKEIFKNPDYYYDSRNEEFIDSIRQGLDPYITPTSDTGIPTPGGQSQARGGAPAPKTDKPDMSVPDFVQPTTTTAPVGVREATASEVEARDKAGYTYFKKPEEIKLPIVEKPEEIKLPIVENPEEITANKLETFVTNIRENLGIEQDKAQAEALKTYKPFPKVSSGVGYMKDGISYDEFGRRTTADVSQHLREMKTTDAKGKTGTSVVSDTQIIPGAYDPSVIRNVFGGSKAQANNYFGVA